MNTQILKLDIEKQALKRFCEQLIKRSRDAAKTHDELITLHTFITRFGQSAVASDAYQSIENMLNDYSEQSRNKLLTEKTVELSAALTNFHADAIAAIHTPLSRNGFYQILQTAIATLDAKQYIEIAKWSIEWLNEAKTCAEQASGYPDAMDFNKAGISINEFQAMQDVERYFSSK